MLDDAKHLTIPSGVNFADLKFRIDGTDYLFQKSVLMQFCRHNQIHWNRLDIHEQGDILRRWYDLHLAAGGARDPVMENLRAEIAAEERVQGGIQIPPGTA